MLFNKFSFGEKGFRYIIGYKVDKKVRSLCILLPEMTVFRRDLMKLNKCLFW